MQYTSTQLNGQESGKPTNLESPHPSCGDHPPKGKDEYNFSVKYNVYIYTIIYIYVIYHISYIYIHITFESHGRNSFGAFHGSSLLLGTFATESFEKTSVTPKGSLLGKDSDTE